jgi:Ca-activated chloride channel homolog
MDSKQFKYKLTLLLALASIYEVVFWVLSWQFLQIMDYSADYATEKVVFAQPSAAIFMAVLPAFWLVYFWRIISRNRYVSSLPSVQLVGTFLKPVSTGLSFLRYFLIRNALVFLVIAAMQPSFGAKTIQGKMSGVELVFVVDLSQSMNTADMSGGKTRLEVAKRAMHQFVNQTSAAKIGMLVFAGGVYPQLPLTADRYAAKMYIDELRTDMISNQGTNIGLALSTALDFFTEDKLKKVVLLITDGEDHEGGIDQAIAKLGEQGVELAILGLGSTSGGLVPVDPDNPSSGYIKEGTGRAVNSKIDAKMLSSIADKAKGKSLISSDAFPNITPLLTQINNLKSTKPVDLEFEVKENRYRVPLSIALICLACLMVLDILVMMRVRSNEK